MNNMNYFNRKPKIVEFHLLKFNEDFNEARSHILSIYKKILYKDSYWHFFYEGEYSIIRCSKKYKKFVEKYFKNNDISYIYKGKWMDGSFAVEAYKERFIPILHQYSILSIELDEEDMFSVADRICHCFFNQCTYTAENNRARYGTNMWEGILMGQLSVLRSHNAGKLDQDIRWKDWVSNNRVLERIAEINKLIENTSDDELI